MPENMNWLDKPYHPISHFYKERFGTKVIKIPVSIADDCPNRRGLKGMQTCIFCDEWGSFAYPDSRDDRLRDQIIKHREKVSQRFNASKFLVYFQAYTTTFLQLTKLKESFDIALEFDDVAGLVVGTRPDCLSAAVLRAWNEYGKKTFMAVELGVQSFDDVQLVWMRRGHTAQQSIQAIDRIHQECPDVDLGVHLIFGWPGETDKQIIETAKLCSSLPISNVKLHNLHVLKNTPLEKLYRDGEFEPLDLETYAQRVGLFLLHLSPHIAVHRLTALSSRWDELVAPSWTRHKMKSFQAIIDYLNTNGIRQGGAVSN